MTGILINGNSSLLSLHFILSLSFITHRQTYLHYAVIQDIHTLFLFFFFQTFTFIYVRCERAGVSWSAWKRSLQRDRSKSPPTPKDLQNHPISKASAAKLVCVFLAERRRINFMTPRFLLSKYIYKKKDRSESTDGFAFFIWGDKYERNEYISGFSSEREDKCDESEVFSFL